ncbi:MAG: hypothetical protein WBE34_21590 [Candidatus Nitrosopolaris sp.]
MLIACISRHAGMVMVVTNNLRRSNTYGGSPYASIARLGLKNGPSMIEVNDFCRQTVLHRLATSISYGLPYQKLDKVQYNSD